MQYGFMDDVQHWASDLGSRLASVLNTSVCVHMHSYMYIQEFGEEGRGQPRCGL